METSELELGEHITPLCFAWWLWLLWVVEMHWIGLLLILTSIYYCILQRWEGCGFLHLTQQRMEVPPCDWNKHSLGGKEESKESNVCKQEMIQNSTCLWLRSSESEAIVNYFPWLPTVPSVAEKTIWGGEGDWAVSIRKRWGCQGVLRHRQRRCLNVIGYYSHVFSGCLSVLVTLTQRLTHISPDLDQK